MYTTKWQINDDDDDDDDDDEFITLTQIKLLLTESEVYILSYDPLDIF